MGMFSANAISGECGQLLHFIAKKEKEFADDPERDKKVLQAIKDRIESDLKSADNGYT